MEAAGLGLAVVGLAGQLFKASLEGYNLLSTTRSFGRDYADLSHRLDTERLRLEKWGEEWELHIRSRKLDPSHRDYRFAVATLARISAIFVELLEYSSKYGMNCHRQTRKRDILQKLFRPSSQLPTITTHHRPEVTGPTHTGLSPAAIERLTDPSLWDSGQVVAGLENEVKELGDTAERLQKMLPAMSQLRWSVVDKDKLEKLINQLKEHNKSLYLVLSGTPKSQHPEATIGLVAPSFTITPSLPFNRNRMFCGRGVVIDTIHSVLSGSALCDVEGGARSMSRKSVVLHGLGGIGKSSIALEYAFRYSNSFTAVFWVDVTSEASMFSSTRSILGHIISEYAGQGFANGQIASMLALEGVLGRGGQISADAAAEPRLAEALRKWLAAKNNENWLLILDNYDDGGVNIHLLLPTCDAGNVIITSRKSDLQMLGTTVPVEDIDEESGTKLFLKSADLEEPNAAERDLAKQLAAKLGFLPLALTQAGSYISYTKIPLEKYIALLDESFRRLASKGGPEWLSDRRPGNPNRTILTTWEISFASLSTPAQQLLLLCGSLANADIPDRLFEGSKLPFDWVPEEGDEWLMESRAELFRFSLAKRNASSDAIWIHPVVHLWARERLNARSQKKTTQETLLLFNNILKDHDDKLLQDWAFERRIWPHMKIVRRNMRSLPSVSDLIDDAEVFNAASKMGRAYCDHGFYDLAMDIQEWALAGKVRLLGDDSTSSLTTVHDMAWVLNSQAEYGKALEWYQRALDGREKTLGKDHPDTLTTVHEMASVFRNQGEYGKALKWYQWALDGREKTLEKDHPSTLTTVHEMASVFRNQGEYDKALKWYQRALDGKEKTLGKGHPDTLAIVHSMALVFSYQGEYDNALKWYQRALDGTEKTLGKDHPDTLATVHSMASVFSKQGEYDKALKWYQRALDGKEKTRGKDHPDTLATVHSMALVFSNQGEYDNALKWYQRALDRNETTLGNGHPDTLATVNNMAFVFSKQGEYDKALKWYQRALDGYEKTLGKDHLSTLVTVHEMAFVFSSQGEYDKALKWYQRALDGTEKTLGKDHPDTLTTVQDMALVFSNQGEYDQALKWYQRALVGTEKTLRKGHPSTLTTVQNMALVFSSQGEYDKALNWYQRALHGYEKTLGKDHPSTLTTVHNMAWVFSNQGEYDKALKWYQRALDGKEKTLGNDHPSTLTTVREMASVFRNQGEYDKALKWYQRALDGYEKTLGKDHPLTLATVRNMASVVNGEGRPVGV